MNLEQLKREIGDLGRSPVSDKVYPITSDWVPVTDVLSVIERFEKHWKHVREVKKNPEQRKLLSEILGED